MIDITKLNVIQNEIEKELSSLFLIQQTIKSKLIQFSDDKNLKGDELTAWLGEIYTKTLFDGELVDESHEHDFVVPSSGERYAVKARKGSNTGWNKTSSISKIEGEDCPHYLLFIHFDQNYNVQHIWKYPWIELFETDRFKKKNVRDEVGGWYVRVRLKADLKYVVYSVE